MVDEYAIWTEMVGTLNESSDSSMVDEYFDNTGIHNHQLLSSDSSMVDEYIDVGVSAFVATSEFRFLYGR